MAQAVRRSGVKRVPLSEIQNDLSRFLHEAEGEEVVITRNGKPAGLLSASRPRTIGSTIRSKMTRGFCAASSVRARACGRAAESGSRMSNNRGI
jgi:prevent-host-death family protein